LFYSGKKELAAIVKGQSCSWEDKNAVTLIAFALALVAGAASAQEVRGVTDNEIVLGTHADLSGPASYSGTASVQGLRMKIDEVNAAGGINGRKLRLVVEDTQYQVPRAVEAGNKLINRDKVFAIIGAAGTPVKDAVFSLQEKENVPNLFPASQARAMWSPFNRLKFQFNADNQTQGAEAVQWLIDGGRKRFCIEYQDTDYGRDVLAGVQQQLKANNLSPIAAQTHKPTDTDLGTQILNLRNAGCDVIVLGTLIRDGVIAYSTARRTGWNDVDILGLAPNYDPTVAGTPGGATEGLYVATPTYIPPEDEMNAATKEWFERYRKATSKEPTPQALNSYTGLALTAEALKRAGRDLTVDKFIAGMESIKDFKDIFGNPPQSYGPDKHLGMAITYITQVKDGKFKLVARPLSEK
jgi:branched-chain amino acid transport system substrate-binding protein